MILFLVNMLTNVLFFRTQTPSQKQATRKKLCKIEIFFSLFLHKEFPFVLFSVKILVTLQKQHCDNLNRLTLPQRMLSNIAIKRHETTTMSTQNLKFYKQLQSHVNCENYSHTVILHLQSKTPVKIVEMNRSNPRSIQPRV